MMSNYYMDDISSLIQLQSFVEDEFSGNLKPNRKHTRAEAIEIRRQHPEEWADHVNKYRRQGLE